MNAEPALQVAAASFGYGAKPALTDVSLVVPRGWSVALLGTNGSGKSTLLKGLVGLLPLLNGSVRVLGRQPAEARPWVGYLRQQQWSQRVAPMTVRDAVKVGRFGRLGWFRRETRRDQAAVTDAMRRMGVLALADRSLHELSGGQRQRVQLAQVLAQQADVYLLDEPFTGLDLPTQQDLLSTLQAEQERGATTVTATHELAIARGCDLVVLLRGRVVAAGPPQDVCTEDNFVAAFGMLGHAVAGPVPNLLLDDRHGAGISAAARRDARRVP